ncbi:MAG: 1-deoxy-D-xylulose-5-phosphate synthase, partial [Lachnospiraceae bacterium]|nr:1-deoxy-D-xylulose-5-phosphate synthase [Lachnospiraceae bacterium]
FAAGLAAGVYHPVVAVYSTFLQLAYDQILHDVCLNRFPVTFAVDRAGIVGSDGETHQGIFDLSYLSAIPGLTVMAPKNGRELQQMLELAVTLPRPTAIRYPRGIVSHALDEFDAPVVCGECEWLSRQGRVALLAAGSMVETAWRAAGLLAEQGIEAAVANVRFLSPEDEEMLKYASGFELVVTLEENVARGGFGERAAGWLLTHGFGGRFFNVSLPDKFIEHGTQEELKRAYGLDAETIAERVRESLKD